MNSENRTVKTLLFGAALILAAGNAFAAVPAEPQTDVAALQKQVAALQERVAQLEKGPVPSVPAQPAGVPANDADFYDPFRDMALLQHQMETLMGQPFAGTLPQGPRSLAGAASTFNPGYDIKGTDKAYIITFDMPGMDKNKINVEASNGTLVVSGERSSQSDTNEQNGQVFRQERRFGYFSRTIPLPRDAKADSIQAKYDNGILVITIAKKESAPGKAGQAQKIVVQ